MEIVQLVQEGLRYAELNTVSDKQIRDIILLAEKATKTKLQWRRLGKLMIRVNASDYFEYKVNRGRVFSEHPKDFAGMIVSICFKLYS